MANLVEKQSTSINDSIADTKTFLIDARRMIEQINSNLVPSPSLLDKKLALMPKSGIKIVKPVRTKKLKVVGQILRC